jgi:hypothetical protein
MLHLLILKEDLIAFVIKVICYYFGTNLCFFARNLLNRIWFNNYSNSLVHACTLHPPRINTRTHTHTHIHTHAHTLTHTHTHSSHTPHTRTLHTLHTHTHALIHTHALTHTCASRHIQTTIFIPTHTETIQSATLLLHKAQHNIEFVQSNIGGANSTH